MSLPEPDMTSFRDAIRDYCPRWLRRGIAEKLLYTFALLFDLLGDMATNAIALRYPREGRPEALPLIGAERRIRRGLAETAAAYALRLRTWRQAHKLRGGPYGLLSQLHVYYGGAFKIYLVYRSGRRFTLNLDGTIVRDQIVFNPPTNFSVWWLFYEWPDALPAAVRKWGTVVAPWGNGRVWGVELSAAQAADIRLIPTEWNTATASGRIVLYNVDGRNKWGFPPRKWGSRGTHWGGNGARPIMIGVK